jgi:RES domain-containing protein
VTPQKLDQIVECYRIGDPNGVFPIYDATGPKLAPGRWNTPQRPIIYAAEHYSTAMLEKLVHGNGKLPPNQYFIKITVPHGVSYEILNIAALPGWDDPTGSVSKPFGETWYKEQRSAILIVPSVVARLDRNVLINPQHPDARQITYTLAEPIWWDKRLFGKSQKAVRNDPHRPK